MFARLIAEYLGTLLLILVIAFVGDPLAIGAALWVGILMVGNYSGGHFNPAVTLWAYLSHKVGFTPAVMHVVAQCAAAFTVFLLR